MASHTITSEMTYDPASFLGIVQQDTFQIEAPAGGTYYWKHPTYLGDTTIYTEVLIAGLPKNVVIIKGGIVCSDALCTTPVTAGLIKLTHFGG